MNWEASSHGKHWCLPPSTIEEQRLKALASHLAISGSGLRLPILLRAQALVLEFSARQLQRLCRLLQRDVATESTALTYFQRVYVHHSVCSLAPDLVAICVVWLASKVTEQYVDAPAYLAAVESHTGQALPLPRLLEAEQAVLQALRFQLLVYPPFSPLEALAAALRPKLGGNDLQDLLALAEEYLHRALLSDIVLWCAPQTIAAAALVVAREELRQVGRSLPALPRSPTPFLGAPLDDACIALAWLRHADKRSVAGAERTIASLKEAPANGTASPPPEARRATKKAAGGGGRPKAGRAGDWRKDAGVLGAVAEFLPRSALWAARQVGRRWEAAVGPLLYRCCVVSPEPTNSALTSSPEAAILAAKRLSCRCTVGCQAVVIRGTPLSPTLCRLLAQRMLDLSITQLCLEAVPLTDDAVAALSPALTCLAPGLRHVALRGTGAPLSWGWLAELQGAGDGLHLELTRTGPAFPAAALRHATWVGALTLAAHPPPDSTAELCAGLAACHRLRYLSLCEAGLGPDALRAVLEALAAAAPPLHTLRLGNPAAAFPSRPPDPGRPANQLDATAAHALAAFLAGCPGLAHLDLCGLSVPIPLAVLVPPRGLALLSVSGGVADCPAGVGRLVVPAGGQAAAPAAGVEVVASVEALDTVFRRCFWPEEPEPRP
eukprot:EG_transcript_4913